MHCRSMSPGDDGILRTAQTLIVASAPKKSANGLVDLSIALAYLELAALPLGVGTCWAGSPIRTRPVRR